MIRKDGSFYSKNKAAEIAVDIDNKALQDVMNKYHSGLPIDWEGMNVTYRTALNKYAEQYGGRATLTPDIGGIGALSPTFAKYNGIGRGCD